MKLVVSDVQGRPAALTLPLKPQWIYFNPTNKTVYVWRYSGTGSPGWVLPSSVSNITDTLGADCTKNTITNTIEVPVPSTMAALFGIRLHLYNNNSYSQPVIALEVDLRTGNAYNPGYAWNYRPLLNTDLGF